MPLLKITYSFLCPECGEVTLIDSQEIPEHLYLDNNNMLATWNNPQARLTLEACNHQVNYLDDITFSIDTIDIKGEVKGNLIAGNDNQATTEDGDSLILAGSGNVVKKRKYNQ